MPSIAVEGVQLQITLATKQDTFQVPPNTYQGPFLVVELRITNEASVQSVQAVDWMGEISVTDENGQWSRMEHISYPYDPSSQRVEKMVWAFVVAPSSRSFTILLPGEQEIAIDAFLNE